ncbi:MAG: maleylpyruvate isomerase N-terminal domain-containing protein [Dehalococcoidia bacterium]|nr:maleylpyruvate isomerase N-terminal domain-containing protein [Dehalococcoidia bacterium]MDW8119277.1 DinB family protein [Chloroflexota bacterium]
MMARKLRILEEIEQAWRELLEVLDQVPPDRWEVPGVVGSWTVKDLCGHITTWEEEVVENIQRFLEHRRMRQYRDIDAFNARAVEGKRSLSLDAVLADFYQNHGEMMDFLRGLPDTLFALRAIQQRLRTDTYQHYREHAQDLRRWLEQSIV